MRTSKTSRDALVRSSGPNPTAAAHASQPQSEPATLPAPPTLSETPTLPEAPSAKATPADQRVRALRALAPRGEPWEGWRPFVIARRYEEAHDQVTLELTPADGKDIPGFKAGQFLHIKVTIDGQVYVRHYSMSDAAHDDFYRVTIKRALPPPGSSAPAGKVSTHLIDTLPLGATVDVRAPKGRFTLDPTSTTPVVLLAGGVGVTPFLAMLAELTAMNSTRPVRLYYACSRPEEFLRRDELRAIAAKFPHIHVQLICSQPRPGDKPGDYDLTGRINLDLLKRTLPEGTYEFYICGPEAMNADLTAAFKQAGVSDANVHVESFAHHGGQKPPSGPPSASERMRKVAPQMMSFVGAGRVVWSPSQMTLISAPIVNRAGDGEVASIAL